MNNQRQSNEIKQPLSSRGGKRPGAGRKGLRSFFSRQIALLAMHDAEISDAEISRAEFARLVGVSHSRVTQWIDAGQIDGEALVGSGRSARIRITAAIEQLRSRLNIDRRFRQPTAGSTKMMAAPDGRQF